MDRVLMLRLQVTDCSAEVLLNDIPVGRAGPTCSTLYLPVHEFLLAGNNSISLVIDPPPPGHALRPTTPKIADRPASAVLHLLLPRVGQPTSPLQSRSLAELVWAVEEGEVYKAPLVVSSDVTLPIKFPRWRWLDTPELSDLESLRPLVATFLQDIAVGLAVGNPEIYLTASRLRLEELALAYQQSAIDLTARLRSRLQLLHATKSLKLLIPSAAELTLRPCAHGRMLECLSPGGMPALHTAIAPDGSSSAWPVRLAIVSGQCLILR